MADTSAGIKFFGKLALVALGVGLIVSKIPNEPPKKPAEGPPPPKENEFASTDPKVLASNAMLQMAREMHALGQENSAKVYLDEMQNPPPGTAARALEHISDEFLKAGNVDLAARLRKVAFQLYPPDAPSSPATPT